MSIDIDKVRRMLREDSTSGWEDVDGIVLPYVGEMEVVAAISRLLGDDGTRPLTHSFTLRRLLVTLIASKGTE